MLKRFIAILIFAILIFPSSLIYGQATYIDLNNIDNGIVNINYENDKLLAARIIKDNEHYDYILNGNNKLPLQLGNGTYSVSVLENIGGSIFRQIEIEDVVLDLEDENILYLQSIQMLNWNHEMEAIKKAEELTKDAQNNNEKIEIIYNFIVDNIKYDHNKPIAPGENYIPNIDDTLESMNGICYDYSSLFGSMLRSLGIPTKLVMGRKDDIEAYHSWNEVYLEDENKWVTIDTTYDAGMKNNKIIKPMIKDINDFNVEKFF